MRTAKANGATTRPRLVPSSTVVGVPRLLHARTLRERCPSLHVAFREAEQDGDGGAAVVPQSEQAPSQEDWDPFYTAGLRLQTLLSEAGWDEGEQIREELLNLPVVARMAFFTNVASILLVGAMVINWITEEQVLGGMSLTSSCMLHFAFGGAFALPLVLTSLLGRLPRVRRSFPVLEGLHDAQEKVLRPAFHDLDAPQMMILTGCIILPALLFLLPVAHGSLNAFGAAFQEEVLAPLGIHIPGPIGKEFAILVPILSSSYFAGAGVSKQLALKRPQLEAIRSAVTHSDRYFRLSESMARGGDPSGQSSKVSQAFKAVSGLWILQNRKVCQLGFVLTAINVCYLGTIWNVTHDLATPLGCGALAFATELVLSRRAAEAKERVRRRAEEQEEEL